MKVKDLIVKTEVTRLVAMKVMGWIEKEVDSRGLLYPRWVDKDSNLKKNMRWSPFTEYKDAFDVVAHLEEQEGSLVYLVITETTVEFWNINQISRPLGAVSRSNGIPRAICLAALQASGIDISKFDPYNVAYQKETSE